MRNAEFFNCALKLHFPQFPNTLRPVTSTGLQASQHTSLHSYKFYPQPSTFYLTPSVCAENRIPRAERQSVLSSIQHRVSSIEYPASSIQHRVSSIEYPASSIQYRVSSIEYRVSSIEYPASSIEPSWHPIP